MAWSEVSTLITLNNNLITRLADWLGFIGCIVSSIKSKLVQVWIKLAIWSYSSTFFKRCSLFKSPIFSPSILFPRDGFDSHKLELFPVLFTLFLLLFSPIFQLHFSYISYLNSHLCLHISHLNSPLSLIFPILFPHFCIIWERIILRKKSVQTGTCFLQFSWWPGIKMSHC